MISEILWCLLSGHYLRTESEATSAVFAKSIVIVFVDVIIYEKKLKEFVP